MRKSICSRVIVFLLFSLVLTLGTTPLQGSPLVEPEFASTWSTPVNLSGWQNSVSEPVLRVGADGTQAAFWWQYTFSPSQMSLWASVLPPGGNWSPAERVSAWQPTSTFSTYAVPAQSYGVAPDGTAWAAWMFQDTSQPGNQWRVMSARKPPGLPWQTEPLSNWEYALRSTALHIGPEGDIAATWIACSGTGSWEQGPCVVRVRRRPAGTSTWETLIRIDNAPPTAGILFAYPLVGPGGLIVVQWFQANASSQWAVMARSYSPTAGAWGTGPTQLSSWGVKWPVDPVMGMDGTVVTAWTGQSPDPAKDVLYSATRPASTGSWSPAVEISSRYVPTSQTGITGATLAIGQNGTAVVAWEWWVSPTQKAIYANARDPGGVWGGAVRVSNWHTYINLEGLDIWPGGTVVLLWEATDLGKPANADSGLFWSGRQPYGNWGGGGSGQLGAWMPDIYGAALALGQDGTAVALWAPADAGQPANRPFGIQAATWPSGGPWGAPQTLASGHEYTYVDRNGLVVGLGGQLVGAAWQAVRHTDSYSANFYSGFGGAPARQPRAFLPIVMRQ